MAASSAASSFPVERSCARVSCRKEGIHLKVFNAAEVFSNREMVMTSGGTQPKYAVGVWSAGNQDADRRFGLEDDSPLSAVPVLTAGKVVIEKKKKYAENYLSAQELFETFLRSRQGKSDFVSKASDVLWKREMFDIDDERLNQVRARLQELQKLREGDEKVGYLKLSRAKQWKLGMEGAPNNRKPVLDDMRILEDDRRGVAFLEYEALKRELSLITTTIATICSIYCVVVFSFEVSASYALGAVGSLLYLQLLFHRADNVSEKNVASVFRRKHRKKIGIRGGDLQHAFEKAFFGSSYALLSPRLLIPMALYGLWTLQRKFYNLPLDLEITPMMFGFFAYKAALLVQTFRENKELAMEFEKDDKETGLGS